MIYLITGTPGTGKTSMVVDMILSNYDGLFKMTTEDGSQIDRPLYFCHIDGLDVRKFKAHELTEEEIMSAPLVDLIPTGSVLIVDECDYVYPVRSSARGVPDYVRTLKELRHHGFTLILMTQHPTMIDKYIRNLVGKHIHLERKTLGTKRYEFFKCEENLSPASFQNVPSNFYSPPKQAFQYYRSATQHIKFKRKTHWIVYVLPVAILYLIYSSVSFFSKFTTTDAPESPPEPSPPAATSVMFNEDDPFKVSAPMPLETASEPKPLGSLVQHYKPTILSLPETKPIYDSLRQPINMETVAGCVATQDSCNCYTEQATKVYVNESLCREYVKNGVFQIYRDMNPAPAIAKKSA